MPATALTWAGVMVVFWSSLASPPNCSASPRICPSTPTFSLQTSPTPPSVGRHAARGSLLQARERFFSARGSASKALEKCPPPRKLREHISERVQSAFPPLPLSSWRIRDQLFSVRPRPGVDEGKGSSRTNGGPASFNALQAGEVPLLGKRAFWVAFVPGFQVERGHRRPGEREGRRGKKALKRGDAWGRRPCPFIRVFFLEQRDDLRVRAKPAPRGDPSRGAAELPTKGARKRESGRCR